MYLHSPAIVIDAHDIEASRDFLTSHLGFEVSAEGEGFVVLGHADHGMRIIFRPLAAGQAPVGNRQMQIGFLVKDVDAHWKALGDTVTVTDPIVTVAATRERSFQIVDHNGILYRLIEFV